MKCPYCNNETPWVNNAEKYGKSYGKSYMCYWCKACDAYVGCHENSKRALGTMANKELRQWRMKAHTIIDPYWKSGQFSRKQVYSRLNEKLGKIVHVGEADIETCKEIIRVGKDLFQLLLA